MSCTDAINNILVSLLPNTTGKTYFTNCFFDLTSLHCWTWHPSQYTAIIFIKSRIAELTEFFTRTLNSVISHSDLSMEVRTREVWLHIAKNILLQNSIIFPIGYPSYLVRNSFYYYIVCFKFYKALSECIWVFRNFF